jgi:hypothetical protein
VAVGEGSGGTVSDGVGVSTGVGEGVLVGGSATVAVAVATGGMANVGEGAAPGSRVGAANSCTVTTPPWTAPAWAFLAVSSTWALSSFRPLVPPPWAVRVMLAKGPVPLAPAPLPKVKAPKVNRPA